MSDFMGRVARLQAELKAPKGQYNSFGKYKYRSCEDILEAAKPLSHKYNMILTVSDEMQYMGDRHYIKATATLWDTESSDSISSTAFAREPSVKKGMDDSQITGAASSYARKYALNGLLCIDDTKDADTEESRNEAAARAASQSSATQSVVREIKGMPELICVDCGSILATTAKRDGTMWMPDDIAAYSKRRFGRVLCPTCQKEAVKAEKAHAGAAG